MFTNIHGFPQFTKYQATAIAAMFLKISSHALKKRLMNLFVSAKKAGFIESTHDLGDFITRIFLHYVYTSAHQLRQQYIPSQILENCSCSSAHHCSYCEKYNQDLLQRSHLFALNEINKILTNPMNLEDLFRKNCAPAVNHAWKSFRTKMISKHFDSWKSVWSIPRINLEQFSEILIVDLRKIPEDVVIDPDSGACYF